MAIKRNRPSSTEVGISVSGVGNISKDRAIRVLESKPDNLVSLTFTMLKTNILPSVTFHFVMFSSQTLCFYTQGKILPAQQAGNVHALSTKFIVLLILKFYH